MISEPLAISVRAAGNMMRAAHEPWWIIAGAAVALHGADAGQVSDVDVLLSVGDAERLFPTFGLELRRGPSHANFRSGIFGTFTEAPLQIEFMANFRYRVGGNWLPANPRTREAVEFGETTVFVPGCIELQQMLRGFGRPKDIERAEQLSVLQS
ncbi:hypothetical protein KY084_03975 [Stakelama sp. CBK3Z-3]|uniref:Nucleotidyltransferase family protein n=1 Tax=Stakelama flava TaxID=2860338 RepID=A0ABS6XKU5_9SPHN|nr:hypothetical protein [Stakelama flava]MBW4330030.1 hypothetical protein [Stakelama flava]